MTRLHVWEMIICNYNILLLEKGAIWTRSCLFPPKVTFKEQAIATNSWLEVQKRLVQVAPYFCREEEPCKRMHLKMVLTTVRGGSYS